jgi:hypothetical protein
MKAINQETFGGPEVLHRSFVVFPLAGSPRNPITPPAPSRAPLSTSSRESPMSSIVRTETVRWLH